MQRVFGLMRSALLLGARVMMLVTEATPATLARRFTAAQFAGQRLDGFVATLTPDEEPTLLALLSVVTTDDEVAAPRVREACRPSGGGVAMKNHSGRTISIYQGSFTACYNGRTITGVPDSAYPSVELTAFANGQIRVR